MTDKHPYTSGLNGITQTFTQFRKTLPAVVDSGVLKKLGFAPNNEGYLINILKFVGIIDAENKRTAEGMAVFTKHEDSEFQKGLTMLLQKAYVSLFETFGPDAWSQPVGKLVGFFRQTDSTSDIVGRRQATTFQTLAALAGQQVAAANPSAKPPKPVTSSVKKPKSPVQAVKASKGEMAVTSSEPKPSSLGAESMRSPPMALSVRVEINLPADGTQETYDAIFKSIRENLLNGNEA